MTSYEIIPKHFSFELYIDGEFAGSFDTYEEAKAEISHEKK